MAIDPIFGVHGAALIARSRRAEVLAANLANADTPNYKARDVDFSDLMRGQIMGDFSGGMVRTDARHLSTGNERFPGAQMQYRQTYQPSLDGNTVDTQIEQAEFMKNAMQYQASLEFLSNRIAGLRSAIRGD